jgi:molybdopterin-containing oxidoreductase family membrane subunit
MFTCNSIIPWLLWSKKVRTSMRAVFIVCIFVNVGMWFERFVIITSSLTRAFSPGTWEKFYYGLTYIELAILAGSFAWFFMWFLLFVKFLPAVSIAEVKEIVAMPNKGKAA